MPQEIVSSEYSGGIRTTKYEIVKLCIFNNTFANGEINNSDYEPITLKAGTLLGRVATTNLLTPHSASASDGSQFPVGALAGDYTIEDGDTVQVSMVVSGEVNENAIILNENDDFDTVISGKTLRDRIGSDTVGITLVPIQELGNY
jgi:hypothetical protein